MKKVFWKSKVFARATATTFVLIGLIAGYQNCGKDVRSLSKGDISLGGSGSLSPCTGSLTSGSSCLVTEASCGSNPHLSTWYEPAGTIQRIRTCSGSTTTVTDVVQLLSEKICLNGNSQSTGNNIDGDPISLGTCPSQPKSCEGHPHGSNWFISNDTVSVDVTCSNGGTTQDLYERYDEYSCNDGTAAPTAKTELGLIVVRGDCAGLPKNCGPHSHGSVWYLEVGATETARSCTDGKQVKDLSVLSAQYTCLDGKVTATGQTRISDESYSLGKCATDAAPCGPHLSGSKYFKEVAGKEELLNKVCSDGKDAWNAHVQEREYSCSNGVETPLSQVRAGKQIRNGICPSAGCQDLAHSELWLADRSRTMTLKKKCKLGDTVDSLYQLLDEAQCNLGKEDSTGYNQIGAFIKDLAQCQAASCDGTPSGQSRWSDIDLTGSENTSCGTQGTKTTVYKLQQSETCTDGVWVKNNKFQNGAKVSETSCVNQACEGGIAHGKSGYRLTQNTSSQTKVCDTDGTQTVTYTVLEEVACNNGVLTPTGSTKNGDMVRSGSCTHSECTTGATEWRVTSAQVKDTVSCGSGGSQERTFEENALWICSAGKWMAASPAQTKKGALVSTGNCTGQKCGDLNDAALTWKDSTTAKTTEVAACGNQGKQTQFFSVSEELKCMNGALTLTGQKKKGALVQSGECLEESCGSVRHGDTTWVTSGEISELEDCTPGYQRTLKFEKQLQKRCSDATLIDLGVSQKGKLTSQTACGLKPTKESLQSLKVCTGGAICGSRRIEINLGAPQYIEQVVVFAHDNMGDHFNGEMNVLVDGKVIKKGIELNKSGNNFTISVKAVGSVVRFSANTYDEIYIRDATLTTR